MHALDVAGMGRLLSFVQTVFATTAPEDVWRHWTVWVWVPGPPQLTLQAPKPDCFHVAHEVGGVHARVDEGAAPAHWLAARTVPEGLWQLTVRLCVPPQLHTEGLLVTQVFEVDTAAVHTPDMHVEYGAVAHTTLLTKQKDNTETTGEQRQHTINKQLLCSPSSANLSEQACTDPSAICRAV